MPYTPELADAMRDALRQRPGIAEKKMFGGYCWMLNGNMICGVEVGRYMFRVGSDQHDEALRRPGAMPMDITGTPMRGFVWVAGKEAQGSALTAWIDLAMRYVGALPTKKPKTNRLKRQVKIARKTPGKKKAGSTRA
jgi:hypothetical protein